MNDESIHKNENTKPTVFYDVKVYVGNNWNEPIDGKIKDLIFETKGEEVKVDSKGYKLDN